MKLKGYVKILAGAAVLPALLWKMSASAVEEAGSMPFQIESTAYYEGEVTASGQKVREGICAGRKEWLGLTCIVYEDDDGSPGDYIGIYEMLDTGSDRRIREGKCIDIYMPEKETCLEWGRRKVWVQLVEADG